MSDIVAILLADIHISTCPPARANEPDWFEAMARPLEEVRKLVKQHDCPVLCAGDVFDKHNASPELINWAIGHLPEMIAIPGQHDLPYHSLKDIDRSAFWTLVEANVITSLGVGVVGIKVSDEVMVWGFPYGADVVRRAVDEQRLNVALIHSYVWNGTHHYQGAPKGQNIHEWCTDDLKTYDVAVFGDNHDGWGGEHYGLSVYNCGCLIPRKSDERKYKPSVGLLDRDGRVWRHYLDCSKDMWMDPPQESEPIKLHDVEEFLDGLRILSADSLDFRQAINRYLDRNDARIDDLVRIILREAVE